jgi:hypothetical protein
MRNLNDLLINDSGWTLNEATAINDKGQIVGNGVHNGNKCAFLLTPVDVPFKTIVGEVAIDPLALILPNDIYVKIHSPYPPLTDVVRVRIREAVRAMGPQERKDALSRAKVFGDYLKVLEQELSQQ